MALGGGTFTTQNKALPGAYINFVSAQRVPSLLGERGVCALPLELSWGAENTVLSMTNEEFTKNSFDVLGYKYDSPKLKGLRDLFINATKVYLYRLNAGVKAQNDVATAKYGGIRGNDITIVVQKNIEDEAMFDVITLVDNKQIDKQVVASTTELKSNNFIEFKTVETLTVSAGIPLTGGTDGVAVTGEKYQEFLDKIESYTFHSLGCLSIEKEIKALFTAFTRRMRDEVGAKFQTVIYRAETADYEGIVSLENKAIDVTFPETSLVYWLTGALGGCAVNASLTNHSYNGSFEIEIDYKQSDLEKALETGKLILHRVGEDIRILEDINTYRTYTAEKNQDFSSNQTIRVLDQIAMDIAGLFNDKYLGKIPNNEAGRLGFWNGIVAQHKQLEQIQAIDSFDSKDVVVEAGSNKKSVIVSDKVTPVNAMAQLYMNVVVE